MRLCIRESEKVKNRGIKARKKRGKKTKDDEMSVSVKWLTLRILFAYKSRYNVDIIS